MGAVTGQQQGDRPDPLPAPPGPARRPADAVSTLPFAETETMIKGVYSPERFLEIFRDYIYFQDSIYDSDEQEIVCRYPQFLLQDYSKQSIIKSVVEKSGKGGTYFGQPDVEKHIRWLFLHVSLHFVVRIFGNRFTNNYINC